MSISAQAFTDAGRTMLGRANNGELLTFDTMVIGAGVAASTPALYPLVALIDHRFNVAITAKVDQGNGILVLDGVINSADIPVGQGFNLCELGLMAHIALEAPALYSVANVLATTPDYIPDAVENPTAVHAFKIKVVIDRATNVTVVLGTSTDIIAENMGPALDPNGVAWPGVFHEKLANTLRFKRLTPGTGIEITEAPLDPFNITIGQKTLTIDLDLYVPLSHPGGTPETRFATIQDAIVYLQQYTIPSNRFATIYVGVATVDSGSIPITNDHPNANQIRIYGEDPIIRTVTTPGTITGAAGNWVFTLDVDDVTGFVTGDYVAMRDTPCCTADGVWQVQSVTATQVVLSVKTWNASFALGGGNNCLNATIAIYPSKLTVTNNHCFELSKNTPLFGSIENLLIRSLNGPVAGQHGFHVSSTGNQNLKDIALVNFYFGINAAITSSSIQLDEVSASGCVIGAACDGGRLYVLSNLRTDGNTNSGIQIENGGNLGSFSNALIQSAGNQVYGIILTTAGRIYLPLLRTLGVYENVWDGINSDTNSVARFVGGNFWANLSTDLRTMHGSQVFATVSNITGTLIPANQTLGTDGAYNDVSATIRERLPLNTATPDR